MRLLRKALSNLPWVFVIMGLANFFWFSIESMRLGGDAFNGYMHNGSFYVGSHGSFTQVTQQQWEWSRLHAISVFITFPLAFFSLIALFAQRALPALFDTAARNEMRSHVQTIHSTGRKIASDHCSGVIHGIRFGNMVHVTVFTSGLTIRVLFFPLIPILQGNIRNIEIESRGSASTLVRIQHSEYTIASPVVLYTARSSKLLDALFNLKSS